MWTSRGIWNQLWPTWMYYLDIHLDGLRESWGHCQILTQKTLTFKQLTQQNFVDHGFGVCSLYYISCLDYVALKDEYKQWIRKYVEKSGHSLYWGKPWKYHSEKLVYKCAGHWVAHECKSDMLLLCQPEFMHFQSVASICEHSGSCECSNYF
jgi:hypothetical protein